MFSLFFFIHPRATRDGTTHRELGPPTSITNQENAPFLRPIWGNLKCGSLFLDDHGLGLADKTKQQNKAKTINECKRQGPPLPGPELRLFSSFRARLLKNPARASIVSIAKGRDATVSLEHLCFCQHTYKGTVGVTESGVWCLKLELNPLLMESDVNPG